MQRYGIDRSDAIYIFRDCHRRFEYLAHAAIATVANKSCENRSACTSCSVRVSLHDNRRRARMVMVPQVRFRGSRIPNRLIVPFLLQFDCLGRALVHACTAFSALLRALDLRQVVDYLIHSRRAHFFAFATSSAPVFIDFRWHRILSPDQRIPSLPQILFGGSAPRSLFSCAIETPNGGPRTVKVP